MSRYTDSKEFALRSLSETVDKVVQISQPEIVKYIEQSRRSRPDASPEEIINVLGGRFAASVAGTGAAAGATAAAPGVGTPIAVALAAGDALAYTGVAALYTFALAEIYGVPIAELERRRTILLGILIGDSGATTVQKMAGRTGSHWAKKIVASVPVGTLRQINKVLGKNFVTKYGTKQGILVLGKTVPFGIGAVIGGAGNAVFAQFTIRSARRAFGPPPDCWPSHLAVVDPGERGEHLSDGPSAEMVDAPQADV